MELLSQTERDSLILRGYQDPAWFCHFFLERWFPTPLVWFQRGILAILLRRTDFLLNYGDLDKIERNFTYKLDPTDSSSEDLPIFLMRRDEEGKVTRIDLAVGKFTLLMIPRGFSKTTLSNAANIIDILYADSKFLVYVSESSSHSEAQLGNVKAELESNDKIIAVFGGLRPEQRTGKRWAQDEIETVTGVFVIARGRDSQIRGLNRRGMRPKKIIVDDVETKESVSTEDQRKKTKDWAVGDLLPALSQMDPEATITALGTLLHRESLLMAWAKDPRWTTVIFSVYDKDGELLWAAMMDEKKLAAEKHTAILLGMLSTFYMEWFNQVRNPETQKFKGPFLYTPRLPLDCPWRAIAIDPALSEKKDASLCAFGVVGMTEGGIIHVFEILMGRGVNPREQVDTYFELNHRFSCTHHGVEAINYQAALVHLLREEMFRKAKIYGPGAYFEVQKITHGMRKEERIEGVLQPRYAAGYVTHQRPFPEYEAQLLDFPNGPLDGPDVVAMAVSLLDPFAPAAAGKDVDLGEDEYKETVEEMIGGNWRPV